jgi:hypothetical protein
MTAHRTTLAMPIGLCSIESGAQRASPPASATGERDFLERGVNHPVCGDARRECSVGTEGVTTLSPLLRLSNDPAAAHPDCFRARVGILVSEGALIVGGEELHVRLFADLHGADLIG